MSNNILRLVDGESSNSTSAVNNEPIIINSEEIIFTSCIEIPSGFKVEDLSKVNIKYTIDRGSIGYGEINDEIVAEIFNQMTILKVKAIKLIGTLNYCVFVNGFIPENKDLTGFNYPSFFSSGTINLNNNICYYMENAEVDLEKLNNYYKIYIETTDTYMFTQDGVNTKILDMESKKVNKESEEILYYNLSKKYLIINSKVFIDKNS